MKLTSNHSARLLHLNQVQGRHIRVATTKLCMVKVLQIAAMILRVRVIMAMMTHMRSKNCGRHASMMVRETKEFFVKWKGFRECTWEPEGMAI